MLTRGFLGGRRDPEALGLDDEALIELQAATRAAAFANGAGRAEVP